MIKTTSRSRRAARQRLATAGLALLLAVPVLSFGQAAGAAPSTDTAEKDKALTLDTFSVVGSRIRRIDAETPSPTVRLTTNDLRATGFTNVDDALRALPFNNAISLSGDGAGTAGTSTVNLRGLGNNNTLVLLNGRRSVPSGSGLFNGFQSVIDLRQIPTAAIESLEVLKDGASAIYGSDAVAGVINIRLRRNYTGVGVDFSYGNTFGTDSHEVTGFVIAGASTDKTSIVATADFSRRAALMNRDFAWAGNADLRADRTSTAQFETNAAGQIVGADQRSSFGFPSRFFVPGTNTQRTYLTPTTDPAPGGAVAVSRATGAGFYNFQAVSSLTTADETRGFGVYVKHEFTESLYGFADIFFKRIESINVSAAAPFTPTDKGASPIGRLVVPASNPYNPYGTRYFGSAGQSIELNSFRVVGSGPREIDANSDYPRYLFGLGGKLPGDWEWEGAYMYAQGSLSNRAPGTVFDNRVQEALMGLNIGGQVLYANPFGPEDPRVTDYYTGTNPTVTSFTANLYDLTVNGTLFKLPAGDVGAAAGLEYRTEVISDVRTLENENGNIVGGSEGFGYYGSRKVTSAYAELSVPVVKGLEIQAAARHESYSDFGKTTKPKLAVAYRPTKWLMLRASVASSFKAPDLAFLYTAGQVGFTAGQLFDPRRPDLPSAQIKTVGRGNPNLQPEETDTSYAGFIVDIPSGPLKGLQLDVGYFKFEQNNLITRDTPPFTLQNELLLPAGRVVRKALTPAEIAAGITVGAIDFLANDWYNANKVINAGWDFSANYSYRTASWGTFRAGLSATYAEKIEAENVSSLGVRTTIDVDGTDSVPLWRGNATLGWSKGDWSASLFIAYIGGYPRQAFGNGAEPDARSQIRWNPQISWRAPWNVRVTAGVRNVFNAPPPRYLASQFGYNPGVNPVEPAFGYIRLSREF